MLGRESSVIIDRDDYQFKLRHQTLLRRRQQLGFLRRSRRAGQRRAEVRVALNALGLHAPPDHREHHHRHRADCDCALTCRAPRPRSTSAIFVCVVMEGSLLLPYKSMRTCKSHAPCRSHHDSCCGCTMWVLLYHWLVGSQITLLNLTITMPVPSCGSPFHKNRAKFGFWQIWALNPTLYDRFAQVSRFRFLYYSSAHSSIDSAAAARQRAVAAQP